MAWADVENNNNGERTPYSKFPEGATMIRILDDEPYSFWQHWLPKQRTGVVCMGKDCPICAVNAQAKANNEQQPYGNTKRHAIRIWNYTTNQMEILIQGKTFFSQLLTLHKEVGDLKTYDVKVVRKGNDKDTTYTLLPAAPSEFEHADAVTELDISTQLSTPTKEEVIQLMEGKTWKEINGNEDGDAA